MAYGSYIHALPAFLRATVIQSRVSALDIGQKFILPPPQYVPILPPPLLLKPKIPLRHEGERAELLEKLGEGEVINYNETAHISIEAPIYTKIQAHLSSFEADNRTTTNTTNLLGYRCYLQTVKILTAFLATHHYAAFSSPEQSRVDYSLYAATPMKDDDDVTGKRISYNEELIRRGLPPVTSSLARRELAGNIPEACDGVWNLQSAVVVAQPSPLVPTINFGPPGGVPYLPGYVLPYFDGLIVPDQNFLPSIMRRFFLRNFGNDDTGIDKDFRQWKLGHTSIFRSNSGKILSHIFLCVQAALEAQGRLFVIQSGQRYLGCAIIGYNFHLTINGIVKPPETPEGLRTLLNSLDPHAQAVEEVAEILRGLELVGEGMDEVATEDLKTGKDVWREINRRVRADKDNMESLKDAVGRLSFEERYLQMTKKDVLRWIRLMTPTPGDEEEVSSLPMYLSGDLIYDRSREHEVLASFGPMSPSFLNLSGGRFRFPASSTDIDHASIPDPANGNKRPLERVLVVGKKVPSAVADWKKMLRSREISQNQTKRDAGYRNVAFTQGARDEIWEALKRIPVPERPTKRRRPGDDDEESDKGEGGSNAKKARTKKDTVAELFEDF